MVDLSWSNPANPPEPVTGGFAQLRQISCGAAVAVNGSAGSAAECAGPGDVHDPALARRPSRTRQRHQRRSHRSQPATAPTCGQADTKDTKAKGTNADMAPPRPYTRRDRATETREAPRRSRVLAPSPMPLDLRASAFASTQHGPA